MTDGTKRAAPGLRTRLIGAAAVAGLILLGGCTGTGAVGHVPVSGISGNSGGAELSLHTDAQGRRHFDS